MKGHSSTGKNTLVDRVWVIPADSSIEIMSASETAWQYSADSFTNKSSMSQNKSSEWFGDPVRPLISEGKLVDSLPCGKREAGTPRRRSSRPEGLLPHCLTTKDRLEIDDETRHISLWMDDSPEQTKEIMKGFFRQPEPLSEEEIAAWRKVQELLAVRTGIDIILPTWFDAVADAMVHAGHDVRLRRYFLHSAKLAAPWRCCARSSRRNVWTGWR